MAMINENSPKHWEYYKKLDNSLSKEECENKAKYFKRSCNCRNIEYYKRYYPDLSLEEQEKMRSNKLKELRENNPLTIEYYIKRYPDLSLEEQEKMRSIKAKSVCYQNIEYIKSKNPNLSEEDCENIRKEKIKNCVNKRDLCGEKNGMHKSKRTEKQLAENCPWKIEFYLKHNPNLSKEECNKLLNETLVKTSKNRTYNTKLDYYINKGLSLEEAKIALYNRQSTFSLEKCIKRYGEVKGKEIFIDRQKRWNNSLQENFKKYGDGRSTQSQWAKSLIYEICKHLNIKIPSKEKYINDKLYSQAFAYDFTLNKHIIEFNGDFWHCNPKIYDSKYFNNTKKMLAKDIWEVDKIKQECAEHHGYKYLVIWESEYRENPDNIIQKCLEFLKI